MHALPEHAAGFDVIDDKKNRIGTAPHVRIGILRNPSIDVGSYDADMLIAEVAAYVRLHDEERALHLEVALPDLPIMMTGNLHIVRLALRSIANAAARCAGRGCVHFRLGVHGDKARFTITASSRRPAETGNAAGSPAASGHSLLEEHPVLSHVSQQALMLGGSLSVVHDGNQGCQYVLTLPLGCQEHRRLI